MNNSREQWQPPYGNGGAGDMDGSELADVGLTAQDVDDLHAAWVVRRCPRLQLRGTDRVLAGCSCRSPRLQLWGTGVCLPVGAAAVPN